MTRSQHAVFAALLLLAAEGLLALETDQYWAWGQSLEDSTAAVNAKLTLELERAVADLPTRPAVPECTTVAKASMCRCPCWAGIAFIRR